MAHAGTSFLGCDVPILCGAMSWVSERNLVAAVSNAGGFGVLAASVMTPEALTAEIDATRALTTRPFGVNLVTLHPRLNDQIETCVERAVDLVVLGGSLPPSGSVKRLKSAGIRVVCFAPTLALAHRLVRSGADALIIEGAEAGGHIGPTATSVLAQEILPSLSSVPVFIAGGIGRGEAIAAYLQLGAAACQLGTRFVCATESIAHPNFKAALIKATARDAVVSPRLSEMFSVIPVRALANKAMDDYRETQLELMERCRRGEIDRQGAQDAIENFWAGRLRRAVILGDVENGSLMAGQSVALVHAEQSVAEIIEELVDQAVNMLMAREA
ncbi:MAG: 2-nitropropane dioxygenase [Rhodospirillaceae bacterium]|nr:2-nitropropane dioxygenase [Rhodospirillaceae bacterium]